MKKKIYCFINSGKESDWNIVISLCEDGHCLSSHCSSSIGWAMHDIGINSDWKHDAYKAHCPDGYELIWVDNPDNSKEIDAAYLLNQELAKNKQAQEI